jgi:hypothetical protein
MSAVTDDMRADLRQRIRHLRRTFGPTWPHYADADDVSEVQALARVLDLPDPTLPPLTTAHLPV